MKRALDYHAKVPKDQFSCIKNYFDVRSLKPSS